MTFIEYFDGLKAQGIELGRCNWRSHNELDTVRCFPAYGENGEYLTLLVIHTRSDDPTWLQVYTNTMTNTVDMDAKFILDNFAQPVRELP